MRAGWKWGLWSHDSKAMLFEDSCVVGLSKSIRGIDLSIHLVDLGNIVFSVLANKSLVDTKMLCDCVVRLFSALEKHPLVVAIDGSRVCLGSAAPSSLKSKRIQITSRRQAATA